MMLMADYDLLAMLFSVLSSTGSVLVIGLLISRCSFLPCPANDRVLLRFSDAESWADFLWAAGIDGLCSKSSSDLTTKIF
jgi:hypothetical protein